MIALSPLLGGCLMEYPEMTENGEIGVDPTSVKVDIRISADLDLGDEPSDYSDDGTEWKHRITVAAYDAGTRMLEQKQVLYEDLSESGTLRTSTTMDLHAKEYRFVVWADLASETEGGIYYDNSDLASILYNDNNYRGQTVYKDAFYGSVSSDFSDYRDEWNSRVAVEMQLERPMGVYELVADDLDRFRSRIESGDITGEVFTARVNYNANLPVGFNAYDGITKHRFSYQTFRRTFRVPADDSQELSLAFDYVFMDDEEENIPLTLEISDEAGKVIASTTLDVSCVKNERTVIKRAFLTSQPGDGIGIDTDFEESEDVDLGII